eukprot:TRINITY_DN85236_c0_g1_i1.p1 TRINITY_DN85236_c0_g1~~TRINITY_DN85236_c0_g1_i1.p1  ORF type:complete len:605 (-),score=101.80 TRINITY_DN85236_c0_g1_i1:140-1954(-)
MVAMAERLQAIRMEKSALAVAAALASAALAAAFHESLTDWVRHLLGWSSRMPRLAPLRSGRRIKVAIIGGGIGGSALALWLRDLLGDDQVELVMFTNSPVGGRCQAVELGGLNYEAGAAIVSEMNVLFKALMRRFSLKKRELSSYNLPVAVFNGSRFLFCGVSTAATSGWKTVAKLLTSLKLFWRFGCSPLLKLKGLASKSYSPNFPRLYRALHDGATYAHPRELLSTLGHGCLRLTERAADQWLVRELELPGQLVQELAEPGMRANYGGQSCSMLHAFVGLVSIVGGIGSKCFAVLGGNSQVPEHALRAARPRILRANARVVRRAASSDSSAPWEPRFEVGYYATEWNEASSIGSGSSVGSSPAAAAAAASRGVGTESEAEGLFMEAFHIVVVAHPLEQSHLRFEGCCDALQASRKASFQRCTAHFLRGTLNLRHFAEVANTASSQCSVGSPFEADPQASMPLFAPAQILTTADSTTPFFSIGLQVPVDTASVQEADKVVASAERGEAQVYKIFAPQPLPETELDKWFNRAPGSPVRVIDWYAYPQYSVPQTFQPFVLDQDGVYYLNAIEQVASAMEMSLIGARNVANLVADWVSRHRGPRGF